MFLQFHMVEASYRVREAEKQLHRENGRHPGTKEVAVATGLSMKKLEAVMLTPKAPISLDQKIGFNESLKPTVSHISFALTSSYIVVFFDLPSLCFIYSSHFIGRHCSS